VPLSNLFEGKTVYVTPTLKKDYGVQGFKDIQKIVDAAGGTVTTKYPKKFDNVIPLALQGGTGIKADDPEADTMLSNDITCYQKELLSWSILSGRVLFDNGKLKITPKKRQQKRRSG
jgi:hypothetical protein